MKSEQMINPAPMGPSFLSGPHSADGTAPILRAEGLQVEAQMAHGTSAVLRDINFTLQAGRTLGLVGESGAGKSMIGRVIARHLPAGFDVTAGRLLFGQDDLLAACPVRHQEWLGRRIAFIPQEPMTALNPVLTIGRQFSEHLRRIGVPRSECRARVIEALDEVLLPDPEAVFGKYAFELSGGMCQRVMIAMAFASRPDLVISDEATTALDVSTQAHVVGLLRRMQERRGTGVLFVTHDMGLATHACDDVVVLYAGDVMESGPAKTVFANPRHPYTRALRQATPPLYGDLAPLHALDGQMPAVERFPQLPGCRFAERCSLASKPCREGKPDLRELDTATGHRVRCVHTALASFAPAAVAETGRHATGDALSSMKCLEVRGLSKAYRAGRRGRAARTLTQALHPTDLTLSPGEFVGVVGESGSGKSTLAKLIMGIEEPTGGAVYLNGRELGNSPAEWQRRIGSVQMVFQDARSALNPRRQVGLTLTQAMDARNHLRLERTNRATELAGDVGLAPSATRRYPSQLSGGQRQRVNIGRSLCDLPQVLVADEIVSGLDVSVQAQIMNLLLDLRREHKISLLLISHDLAVVRYLCSRVIVMHKGRVVESGPTEQVLGNPSHSYTRALIDAVPPAAPDAVWPTHPPIRTEGDHD
ncbi:ABC transporter ATP-binding protein [Marinobacter sp. JSM 1782161]|uniref:ABC transporter ATP-binding protein n=1 Tax=Marinobacter sp. JSM 1782161 TaxID=2685906 RepID=UPI001A9F263F|nr:ABC transporter ATP-binding protein [Marinobacter sp. JSM 1782161]